MWTVRISKGSVTGSGVADRRQQVSASACQAQDDVGGLAARFGIKPGQVTQELGYDVDSDETLRIGMRAIQDVELVGPDYQDVVDLVLLWWLDGDGDMVDSLVDALALLADGGIIWLLTPKTGRAGYVEPSDIAEAAPTAGLSQTSSTGAGRDWLASRLVTPRVHR